MNASFLWLEDPEASTHQKWLAVRSWRSRLLGECDWTQLIDAPLTLEEKQAWAAYRQTLRDIPENFTDPDTVELPETP